MRTRETMRVIKDLSKQIVVFFLYMCRPEYMFTHSYPCTPVTVTPLVCTHRAFSPLFLHHLLQLHALQLHSSLSLMVQDLAPSLLHQNGLWWRSFFFFRFFVAIGPCGGTRGTVSTGLRRGHPRPVIHGHSTLKDSKGEEMKSLKRSATMSFTYVRLILL